MGTHDSDCPRGRHQGRSLKIILQQIAVISLPSTCLRVISGSSQLAAPSCQRTRAQVQRRGGCLVRQTMLKLVQQRLVPFDCCLECWSTAGETDRWPEDYPNEESRNLPSEVSVRSLQKFQAKMGHLKVFDGKAWHHLCHDQPEVMDWPLLRDCSHQVNQNITILACQIGNKSLKARRVSSQPRSRTNL